MIAYRGVSARLPYLPTVSRISCITVAEIVNMLDLDAFRDLCRRAAAEKDPAKLGHFKNELRCVLQAEGIEMALLEKKPAMKPN